LTDARRWGVVEEYVDATGRLIRSSRDTVARAMAALGAAERAEPEPPGALILHPGDAVEHPLEVVTEDGRSLLLEGRVGDGVPLGYHTYAGGSEAGTLIISPRRCHLPPGLRLGART